MNAFNLELLVHKKLTNQITMSEALYLEQFAKSNDVSAKEILEIELAWKNSLDFDLDTTFESKQAFQKFLTNIEVKPTVTKLATSHKSFKYFTLKSAMAVAAMFTVALIAFNVLAKSNSTTFNSDNTSTIVFLPEGSEVKLAPNSSITYVKSNFSEDRKIKLSGSGIIHVEKTGKPFIVEGNDFEVKVLGTTFLVESNNKNKSVKVLEGKVEVSHDNMKVIITDKQGTIINDHLIVEDDISFSNLDWNKSDMVYNNTPISKVLADVESKFGVIITLKSTQSILNCTFTSQSLDKMSLPQVINVIEATFSTKFTKIKDNTYSLSALSCR